MSIIYTHQRSRKRKPTAKQRELARQWEELIAKHKPKATHTTVLQQQVQRPAPYRRETPNYPSLNSTEYNLQKRCYAIHR